LVAMGDQLAVGRGHGLPAKHGAVVSDLLRLAHAVGRQRPKLYLTRFVRHGQECLSIGQETSVPITDTPVPGNLDESGLAMGRDKHLAPSGKCHSAAVGGDMRSRKVINWPAHPSFPLLVEITLESDWDGRVFAAGDVVKANVCAELVDDPAV